MAGKIKPGGVVTDSPCGITFTHGGTHAPDLTKGVRSGKVSGKIKPNGVESNEPKGTTFQGNKTPISMPHASAQGKNKVRSSGSKKEFVPKGKGTDQGAGRESYNLKKSYEK